MPTPLKKEGKAVTDRAAKVIRAAIATHPKITTQSLMAETLGVSKQTLSKWMTGEGHITIPDLVSLVKLLKANPYYLIIGTGDMFIAGSDTSMKNNLEMSLADISVRLSDLEIAARRSGITSQNGKKKR